MKNAIAAAALLASLAACATTPQYKAAGSPSSIGYTDQKIEEGRFRVAYRGNSAAEAADGALRRAAELTVAAGFDHFTVVNRDSEGAIRRRSGPSIGVGGTTGSRRSGVGVGVSLPVGNSRNGDTTTRIEILMGRGEKPEGISSYDARSVLANLSGAPAAD